jgi:hypothetical protein
MRHVHESANTEAHAQHEKWIAHLSPQIRICDSHWNRFIQRLRGMPQLF